MLGGGKESNKSQKIPQVKNKYQSHISLRFHIHIL